MKTETDMLDNKTNPKTKKKKKKKKESCVDLARSAASTRGAQAARLQQQKISRAALLEWEADRIEAQELLCRCHSDAV